METIPRRRAIPLLHFIAGLLAAVFLCAPPAAGWRPTPATGAGKHYHIQRQIERLRQQERATRLDEQIKRLDRQRLERRVNDDVRKADQHGPAQASPSVNRSPDSTPPTPTKAPPERNADQQGAKKANEAPGPVNSPKEEAATDGPNNGN